MISKQNLIDDDFPKKIKSELPQGAFLREYKKLVDVDGEIYVGLYITDYADPIEPIVAINELDLSSCRAATLGQSISGNYHAFVFEYGKISSSVKIPTFDENYNLYNTLCLFNTPQNNCYYFDFSTKTEDKNCESASGNVLEKTDLIQLNDLTGDTKRNEFLITGVQDVCGYVNRLVVGYNEVSHQISVYPVVENNRQSYWNWRFVPLNGECKIEVLCGDHGNEQYSKKIYRFNASDERYELIFSEEKECD